MANVRFCDAGRHEYVTAGSRSKCTRCGSVQVDLAATSEMKADPNRVFGARRATLFSVRTEEEEVEGTAFGRPRASPLDPLSNRVEEALRIRSGGLFS